MNPKQLDGMLAGLGITPDLQASCRMPLCCEEPELVDAGTDMFDRPQQMTPATLAAWQAMLVAAAADGIELKLVSAYRSISYQCELIRRKLENGQALEDILCVNAIPGYSEHHTGRALDLHAGDDDPLTESFEAHPAFDWLNLHAGEFGFYLSYPRNNPAGIDYEPWHWCHQPD